jgi:hypothetical protein
MRHLPGPRTARAAAYLALLTAAVPLAAAAPARAEPSAAPVAARAPAAAVALGADQAALCQRYGSLPVATAQGGLFAVKNDNYGGGTECLVNRGGLPNFTITRSPVPRWHAKPQAYPFVLRGCSWGTCSGAGSGLPAQVSGLQRPVATWNTSQVAHGKWDAAFDVWFGTRPMTTGQADGAEVMIWLSQRHVPLPVAAPIVWVDHVRWRLAHWRTCHDGTCWNYAQFRRLHPVLAVRHLHLAPFFRRAEARGWIQPSWWLENIEAGFELWQGGRGLATNWFWARP